MLAFLKEMAVFLFRRKKYWLMPVLIAACLLGGLVVFTFFYSLSTFIYTLF